MSKARELAELSRTVSDSADAVAITIDSSENVTFANAVSATSMALASTGATQLTIEDTDNGFAASKLNVQNGGRDLKVTVPQDIIFNTGGSDRLTLFDNGAITATGDITISSAGPGITLTDTDNNPDYQIKNGNGSFRIIDTTNSVDRININSSAHVGINNNSPEYALDVDDDTGNAYIAINRATQSQGEVGYKLDGGTSGGDWFIYQKTSGNDLNFYQGSDRVTFMANGNVGIGTGTSVSAKFHVVGSPQATSGALAFLRNSDATSSNTTFGGVLFSSSPGTDFSIGKSNVNAATSLSFRNGNTGAVLMDLNASGHLTVGNTDLTPADNSVNGTAILADGRINHNAQSQAALTVGRTGTAGELATFKKNGTTVGKVGAGTYFFVAGGSAGGTHSGLRFINDQSIRPCTSSGGNNDDQVNLGANTTRFKNLYLSGGAYLGGTTSANLLDDYEQGSWALATTALSGVSVLAAQYTKIGQLVVADIRVTWTGSTNDGSAVSFSLPFVSQNPGNSTSRTGIVFYQGSSIFGGNAISAHISQGGSNVSFYNTGGGTFRSLLASDVNGSYNWLVTVSYFTDL